MANKIRPLTPPELQLDWKHNGLPAKKVETVRELIRMLKKLDGGRPVQVAAIRPTVFVEENLIFPDNPTPPSGLRGRLPRHRGRRRQRARRRRRRWSRFHRCRIET